MPHWKANIQHLRIALERMIHNYVIQAECTRAEAITVAEGILKDMKKSRGRRSPYSLGPLDPTQTYGKKRKKDDDED